MTTQSLIDITKLVECRLCRKVTFAVFAAIFIIEIIILIPSYQNFSRDWQAGQAERVRVSVHSILLPLDEESLAEDARIASRLNMLVDNDVIEGWKVFKKNSQSLLAESKNPPSSKLVDRLVLVENEGNAYLDVPLAGDQFDIAYDLQVRINANELSDELNAFVIRILGLVLLITAFVTTITMVVLSRIVLGPILQLRNKMSKAGQEVVEPENHIVYIQSKDELGDVANEFNSMLERTGRHLKIIHENERNLYKNAYYDMLTGLPNRLLGFDRLQRAISLCDRRNTLGALMLIDIDGFKQINDTLGHATGDSLLRQIGKRFSSALRKSDSVALLPESDSGDQLVARIGGDEFMVILPEIDTEQGAAVVAERLCEACKQPIHIENKELIVNASIGISIFPRDGAGEKDIMTCADTALYAVKDLGGGGYRFFDVAMNNSIVKRLEVESELRNALANNELELHFQPLVNVITQSIVGAEALLRWNNAKLGAVSPDRFIPIAESTGLIVEIGQWVLETACSAVKELEKQDNSIFIAVNVSSRQFREENFLDQVRDVLDRYDVAPSQLEIEITESLLVDEFSGSLAAVEKLRELGVSLSIDDFGTGYSALSYLRRVPVDTLKIDRSFITNIGTCEKDASLVRTIITMAHNFGLKVIAEGVENQDHLDFLRESNCHYAQGYYFGKPMALPSLMKMFHMTKVV